MTISTGYLKGSVLVAATLVAACSGNDFDDCEQARTCASSAKGGSGPTFHEGGEAGGGPEEGDAGQGGEGDPPAGGQGGAGGAGPDVECSNDADCDDDDANNGVESCDTGVCVAGNPPPFVVSVMPGEMAVGVEPDGKVRIGFSEAMDPESITNETMKLMDGELEIEGTTEYSDSAAVFTPAQRLSLLTPFTIVVTTGARDLQGAAMLEEFVAEFTVRDGGWTETEAVEDVAVDLGQFDACMGVDGVGNTLVVWHERVGGGTTINQVTARWYRNGGWEVPVPLATTEFDELYHYSCAVNARGDAIVAWTLDGNDVYARQYRNGAWEPQALDVDLDFPGGPMAVGMSPTGEAHVLWAANTQLRARQTNVTGAWANATDLIGNGIAWYEPPHIAFDADGNGFAAWRSWTNNTNRDNVYATQYLAATNVWAVGHALPGSQSNDTNLKRGVPAIAAHEGTAMAVWVSQTSATTFQIVGSHFLGGAWSSNPQLLSIVSGRALLSAAPGLISDGAGFVAAWNQDVEGNERVYRSRFAEGGWHSDQVATSAAFDRMPALGGDPHGNLLLTWAGAPGAPTALRYQRYSAVTSTWSQSANVPGGQVTLGFPLLAVAANGTGAAVWTDRAAPASGGGPLDIFVNLFR